MTSWRAPGRVNLIGEHTDYNDGFALPLAIQAGCTAVAEKIASREPVLQLTSAQQEQPVQIALADLAPGAVEGWAAYPAGVVWALRERDVSVPGLTIQVDGDVPLGAGLSSSAALSCSTAAAVGDLLGAQLTKADLVEVARTSENDFVGAPTGGMDQLASVWATEGHVLLCDMADLSTEPVPFDLAAAGLRLLVIDTRAPHRHSDGEYAARRRSCEQAAELLGVPSLRAVQDRYRASGSVGLTRLGAPADIVAKARHVLSENERVLETVRLLRDGNVAAIGPLLTESHHSMRYDFDITVEQVDVAVETATGAGAVGARMTGGGFGGCVIALTPAEEVDTVSGAVRAAFDRHGFDTPDLFEVHAGAGVHRL